MSNPVLEMGAEGEWVDYLQGQLEFLGYPRGSSPGVFDADLHAAISQYQQDIGLISTGIVDADTWHVLETGEQVCVQAMAINQTVTLVAQPTQVTCWAASIAMLVDKSVDEVVEAAGMNTTDGYGWSEIQHAVSVHGLTEIGPACGGPDYFAPLLEQSPLWIVEVGAPYHAIVLAGLNGDGTWEGTTATVYNPWPPGSGVIEHQPFAQFAEEYELGAGAMAQIVSR